MFTAAHAGPELREAQPDYFADLNLDQIWSGIAGEEDPFQLAPYFYTPLRDEEQVRYRQQALIDIEREPIAAAVRSFVAGIDRARRQLQFVDSGGDPHQASRWMVAVTRTYCTAVSELSEALAAAEPESTAITGLAAYLSEYVSGDEFIALERETGALEDDFAKVRYQVKIRNLHVTVEPYEEQQSLAAQIEETFSRFTRGAAEDHTVSYSQTTANDRIESEVLAIVARHNQELFKRAAAFLRARHDTFMDPVIGRFDREIRFVLAYLDYIDPLRRQGLSFSFPAVSDSDREEHVRDCFDLALAQKLHSDHHKIVTNDFELSGEERMLVITGPNQGGKTTFARMFGQLHHLAAMGFPVPGSEAELFLPDGIYTHFEREENLQTLRSKFEDELVRLHAILEQATSSSLLVMNESFSSTSVRDAIWVGEQILRNLLELGTICLCVTFIDEFARLGPQVVSMMSAVEPGDVTLRTFKVVRKPADGLAHAVALAEKHGIGYDQLKERLA